uniref:Uncharacterized protein n=2 Tax=Dunaliella tertiolecta TaxID=3047 RepID=A0A7S3VI76_DUNTE
MRWNVNDSLNPGTEFQQRDNRPTHDLNEVVTLADVRRAKQLKAEADAQNVRTHQATAWLPKKHRGQDASDGQPSNKGVQFVPTAAARQQLGSEKPALLQRMDDTLARCRVLRDNRNYRLNSLGVFENDKNEVRARSMQRVQVHKDLSTTSMRLPDTHKEVKSERPDSSMEAKLERMCYQVCQSLPEQPAKPPAPHLGTLSSMKHPASMGARATSPRVSMATRQAAALGAVSECGTTMEQTPIRATNPPPMGSVPSRHILPPSSRKVTTTSNLGAAVALCESRRELSRDFSINGSPSKRPTAQSSALQQSASALPTPTPSTVNLPQPESSKVRKQGGRSSRRHSHLRSRAAGPLKRSPFANSLGAGTGMAPRRPASIFRSSKGTEVPIYGRRSSAQANAAAAGTPSHLLQGRKTAAGSREWDLSDVPITGELAHAHFAHVHAVIEDNIARYHKQVGDAQLEFLQDNGLHEEVLRMTPEELQEALEQQLKAERIEEEEESLRQNRSAQGALNPASIKSLVQSALEHTASKTEDLDVLKASLPRAPPKSGRRRRKPSIPMGPKAGANTGLQGSLMEAGGGKAQELSEVWESPLEAEGSSSKLILGVDGELPGAWNAGDPPSKRLVPGFSIVRRHDHRRRTELMRAVPRASTASRLGTEDGASSMEDEDDEEEEEEEEEDALVVQPNEDAHQGLTEAMPPGTQQQPLQQPTFSTTRLDAFKARMEEAATVTVEEFAPQMPALPTIPTMPSVPLHVQARLERVWNLLHLPLPLRLDAVLEYTKHSRLLQFEQALKVWEQATVAVVQREGILDTLLLVQRGVEEGSIGYLTISAIERQCVQLVQVRQVVVRLTKLDRHFPLC